MSAWVKIQYLVITDFRGMNTFFLRCVIPVVCRINQNVMCIQYVIKHKVVLDGMLIY